jgi:hypothetical protein
MMKYDELDRILSEEQAILPSPEFTASVIAAVLREASASAPIAFPWRRVLPGLVASGLALAVLLQQVLVQPGVTQARFRPAWLPDPVQVLDTAKHLEVQWIMVALLLTFASMRLSARLAAREKNNGALSER